MSEDYKLPAGPPSPVDDENRAAFDKIAEQSLDEVRSAADKWRGGLAALVTLITGGLLLKGPDAASDLTEGWRIALTILAVVGIGSAIIGFWSALNAAIGVPRAQNYQGIVENYPSVLIYKLAQAKTAARQLRNARRALLVALPVLGATVIAWWWSGTKAPAPAAYIEVDFPAPAEPVCGTLKSADNGHLIVAIAGDEHPRMIPMSQVANLRIKASC